MTGRTIDLNADVGEGFGIWRLGDDDALLDVVTSANIACGFHAGDPLTALRTCELAAARGVSIGAHVSYRDLVGFGRRYVDASPRELTADVLYQLAALDGMARAAGSRVRYVKPHGALYHRVTDDPVHAAAVVDAVRRYDGGLAVLALPGSQLLHLAAEAGLPTRTEAFCDRAYTAAGGLVPRDQPGSVLHDASEVARRSVGLALHGTVMSAEGTPVAVRADSLCVHGDTPGAVALARAVRTALQDAGVGLRAAVG